MESSHCRKRGRASPPSVTEGPQACLCSRPATCSCGYFGVLFNSLVTPDFEELASQFPDFRKAWKEVENARRNAKQRGESTSLVASLTHSFSAALTKALLHVHFHVSLPRIPVNHLCPPVPNRFFYIRWIQTELLPLLVPVSYRTSPFMSMQDQLSGIMLDIGTGASCIYPLLFAASHQQGHHRHKPYLRAFFATEIDPESVDLARQNAQGNPELTPFVHIVQVSMDQARDHCGPLQCSLAHLPPEARLVDVCITNPPFYDSENPSEMSQMRADGRHRTAMTVSEGSYPGGEMGFVLDILCDSIRAYLSSLLSFANAGAPASVPPPKWCSSMIGKKSSWTTLKNALEQLLGFSHVQSTEFGPGHMTRWFLAWTFLRPHIRSPLAHTDFWSFNVDVGGLNLNNQQQISEIASRVQAYCEGGVQGRQLMIRWNAERNIAIIEEQHEALNSSAWFGDDTLPPRLQQIVHDHFSPEQRRSLLPFEGHFQIEVSIRCISERSVAVTAQAFSHTRYGRMTVEKLKQQMEGEICQTNRKWRRKHQRKRAVEQDGEAMNLS
ncbi:methyltransferase [Fistulifera solaris]|uniref:Methyltransferase n=1 Tax=Fistulifera solaris TaxID=1519565 RepID=A0A1Z5JJS8_FISSO|nr:methyltransferase [Fistulifera solaris]|eukprot:GAX14265.1 methyltransferase [Fistulifera solaris]